MEIIFGENQPGKTKFSKKIGEKTFSYSGTLDKVSFIEEIVFSNISKYKPELIKKSFCSITSINKERFIISFYNDLSEEKPNGEPSLEYTLKDFSEEEIKNFINLILTEQNYTDENVILLTVENNIFTFNNLSNELDEDVVLKETDLDVEILVGGYKKYAKIYISLLVLISIIAVSLYGLNYFKNKTSIEIKSMESQQKVLEKKKKDIEKEIIEEKIKFNKLESKKHLLDQNNLRELDQKIYGLGLKESFKDKK